MDKEREAEGPGAKAAAINARMAKVRAAERQRLIQQDTARVRPAIPMKTGPVNISAHFIQQALDCAIETGRTEEDEKRFAMIEALLRDALGQDQEPGSEGRSAQEKWQQVLSSELRKTTRGGNVL